MQYFISWDWGKGGQFIIITQLIISNFLLIYYWFCRIIFYSLFMGVLHLIVGMRIDVLILDFVLVYCFVAIENII